LQKSKYMRNDKIEYKVLKSEYIFDRPWLKARCDSIVSPNGKKNSEYYVLEYPDWVNTIAITKEGKFVMIYQYRHGLKYTGYELCAGVCEKTDTSFEAAARRELLEETGYGNGKWQEICTICGNTSSTNNYSHCFLATDVEKIGEQHLDATEDLSYELLTEKDVFQLLSEDKIKQAIMTTPLWKYFYYKRYK
jgi:ADP-ribose pyrophosphatase